MCLNLVDVKLQKHGTFPSNHDFSHLGVATVKSGPHYSLGSTLKALPDATHHIYKCLRQAQQYTGLSILVALSKTDF